MFEPIAPSLRLARSPRAVSGVSRSARAFPPLRPPKRPSATAAGFFSRSASVFAIRDCTARRLPRSLTVPGRSSIGRLGRISKLTTTLQSRRSPVSSAPVDTWTGRPLPTPPPEYANRRSTRAPTSVVEHRAALLLRTDVDRLCWSCVAGFHCVLRRLHRPFDIRVGVIACRDHSALLVGCGPGQNRAGWLADAPFLANDGGVILDRSLLIHRLTQPSVSAGTGSEDGERLEGQRAPDTGPHRRATPQPGAARPGVPSQNPGGTSSADGP